MTSIRKSLISIRGPEGQSGQGVVVNFGGEHKVVSAAHVTGEKADVFHDSPIPRKHGFRVLPDDLAISTSITAHPAIEIRRTNLTYLEELRVATQQGGRYREIPVLLCSDSRRRTVALKAANHSFHPGMSGSPVVDDQGNIIGVLTVANIKTDANIGVARRILPPQRKIIPF